MAKEKSIAEQINWNNSDYKTDNDRFSFSSIMDYFGSDSEEDKPYKKVPYTPDPA